MKFSVGERSQSALFSNVKGIGLCGFVVRIGLAFVCCIVVWRLGCFVNR